MFEGTSPDHRNHTLDEIALKLTDVLKAIGGTSIHGIPSGGDPVSMARQIYRRRRKRADFFGDGFFGEAAWDILLDLFVQENVGRKVSVTSATSAAGSPPTTALRWLTVLEKSGYVIRHNDPEDGRRSWVELTDHAKSTLTMYFASL